MASNKIAGGIEPVCSRLTLALASALVYQTKATTNNINKTNKKHKQQAKLVAGIEGQVATILEPHTRKKGTIDTAAIKRAKTKNEKRTTVSRQNRSTAWGRPAIKLLGGGGGFN